MKKSKQNNELNHSGSLHSHSSLYYDNLARITATLLAGLVALFTFLLVVGVQNQVKGFSGPLYATLIVLGVGLALYVIGNIVADLNRYFVHKSERDKDSARSRKLVKATSRSLVAARVIHQIVFVVGVGMVVLFAINYSNLILNPAPVQQPPTSQSAPAPSESQGPAPGETAEQHSQEGQPQQ